MTRMEREQAIAADVARALAILARRGVKGRTERMERAIHAAHRKYGLDKGSIETIMGVWS